jgi:uncharacterized integral membrane protein (TIGR00698 family)
VPGLAVAVAIGAVAVALGQAAPRVGAPVIALLAGIALRWTLDRYRGNASAGLRAGASFAGRYLLQASIVVFGAGLSVSTVLRVGASSLPVMLTTLAICLLGAWLIGRLLRVGNPLRTLVGAGTGICGASAIAAVSPVVAADAAQVAYAVSTIVVYNVTAAVLFPPIGHLLALSPHAFGLWAGTAVNDTSSVMATAYAYGPAAGQYAMVVKLTRSLMIIPVVVGLTAWTARRKSTTVDSGQSRTSIGRLVPPFVVLFLVAAAANSIGIVPAAWHTTLPLIASYGTTVAMSGVGFGTSLGELRRAGLRPLALGGLLSALTAGSSLGVQALTGTLH